MRSPALNPSVSVLGRYTHKNGHFEFMAEAKSNELREELLAGVPESTRRAFREYHKERPHIFKLFREFAEQMRKSGRKRYGGKSIMERIRWHYDMAHPNEEFKISNSFTSLYVRLLIWHDPTFKEFFQIKQLRGLKNPFGQEHYVKEEFR